MAHPVHDGPSLITPRLEAFVNTHWNDHIGAVDGHDIQFLASLLAEAAPTTMIEIGCASGFSTAAIAMMMAERGPTTLHSFDLATRFYADPSKPLGYLVADLELPDTVNVTLHPGKTSLDVGRTLQGAQADFCFIDARHAHPWPILDTLAVLPHMRPGAFIVHHDLKMYRDDRADIYANGPKVVLDHTPEELRVWFGSRVFGSRHHALKVRALGPGNIFALKVPQKAEELAFSLSEGLYLPWDPLPETYISPEFVAGFTDLLASAYPKHICDAFACGLARYNRPIPVPRPGFLRRLTGRG